MNYAIEQRENATIIHVAGELDNRASDELALALNEARACRRDRLLIEMSEVPFISSAALGLLMHTWKELREQGRFMGLARVRPEVQKMLSMIGFGKLLPIGDAPMDVMDILQGQDPINAEARANTRTFLMDLLTGLGVDASTAEELANATLAIAREHSALIEVESRIRQLLGPLELSKVMAEHHKGYPAILRDRLEPYLVGVNRLAHIGGGKALIGEALVTPGRDVVLVDSVRRQASELPFVKLTDGAIQLADDSVDAVLMVCRLSAASDWQGLLLEAVRVARERLLIVETVYLNEVHRRSTMLLDWFYRRLVLGGQLTYNFNSPEGWEVTFRQHGLQLKASVDLGLDMPLVPEYHWLYVLDMRK